MADLLPVDQVAAKVEEDLLLVDQVAARVAAEVRRLEMTSDHRHLMISTMIFRSRQPMIKVGMSHQFFDEAGLYPLRKNHEVKVYW